VKSLVVRLYRKVMWRSTLDYQLAVEMFLIDAT